MLMTKLALLKVLVVIMYATMHKIYGFYQCSAASADVNHSLLLIDRFYIVAAST